MAAYAALRSLFTTLNNIQIHPRVSTFFDNQHILSLHQIINFLLHFMETRTSHGEEDEVLERQIASTTHKVEDVIESHVVNKILPIVPLVESDAQFGRTFLSRPTRSTTALFLDLQTQIQHMNSLKEMVMHQFQDDSFSPAPSSKPLTTTNNNFVVGFDEKVIQIMDRLTGHLTDLQIVPIVGMGGIGKTTLAKTVYDHLLIVESFDIRAWVTVSQEYSLNNLLSQLLSCIKDTYLNKSIGVVDFETSLESEDHQLGLKLHQTLCGRRYLIVLDDIWSIEAWYRIKNFFPNNNHRSRVVITTRISSVATPLSSSSFEMDFLNEDQSWELFCRNVFLEKGCPHELEEIGKKIVRECKGLPLSIVVIGGLLRHSISTREYWEKFARDLNSILMLRNDEHCLNILSLSYNHLPTHLKPCFLYMGVFQEDENIDVSSLINVLVAEGFLKPKEGLTMEEVAADYINDLVDRNLILARSWKWNGSVKYFKMHDLVRELCLKIGGREKIFHRTSMLGTRAGINTVRRIVLDTWPKCNTIPLASLARTFLSGWGFALPFKFRLLRVLVRVHIYSHEVTSQHVNLRYLEWTSRFMINHNHKLPSSISLLWNVHTLIFKGLGMDAPSKIWYMRQLRHLQSHALYLPDPPSSEEDEALLPNLHTLLDVVDLSFTEEVCKRIPNIKKLGIASFRKKECQKKCYFYLNHLRKLQSLHCHFEVLKRGEFLQSLMLPSSLRKLSLRNYRLHWEDVNTFGLSLPHLQVLKLRHHAFVGPTWDCVEGAFPCLKFLDIKTADLIKWSAESLDCFPVLVKLQLFGLENLERIPSDMGEIQTLRSLRVRRCSMSAAITSVEILEEQLSLGNDDLQLVLELRNEEEEKLNEEVEINSFTAKNFELISRFD